MLLSYRAVVPRDRQLGSKMVASGLNEFESFFTGATVADGWFERAQIFGEGVAKLLCAKPDTGTILRALHYQFGGGSPPSLDLV